VNLLFDENLSPRLVRVLDDEFPGSQHVGTIGLLGEADHRIWEYARQHSFTIVSKDNDFRQLAFLHGPPPKVIWLSVGNAGTDSIARLLHESVAAIESFLADPEAALLVLDQPSSDTR
jgi:predicted nuclease of predicted toxin-antitoxin system